MGCEAQLASKCLFSIHGQLLSAADFDPKVGQTDLVFDVQSGFISTCRSVRARLQVSVCSGHHGILQTDTHREHFDQLI